MQTMKQSLLDESQTIITNVNNQLKASNNYSNHSIEGFYQVVAGKGFKKDQIMFTLYNKGNWGLNIIINIDTMEIKKTKPLGKYSSYDNNEMLVDTNRIFYHIIKNELLKALQTNHMDELKLKDLQLFEVLKDKVNNDPDFAKAFINKSIDDIKVMANNTFKHDKSIATEAVNLIINKLNPSYKVGNRSFNSYNEAFTYCNDCDFDPETMIQTA